MGNFNIVTAGKMTITPIAPATTTLPAGGGNSWVDTDVSATTGTNTATVWVVIARSTSGMAGVRVHGSAIDSKTTITSSATFLSSVDSSGHIDYYRENAGDLNYTLIGYLS